MTDSQKPGPFSPTLVNQVGKETSKDQPSKELIARRVALVIVTVAVPAVWFWPAVDLFLEGKVFALLNTLAITFFTGMVWWSTEKAQRISLETLGHLRTEFAAEHRPWISVRVEPYTEHSLRFDANDGSCLIYLRMEYENTGGIPAIGLHLRWKLLHPGENPIAVQSSLANQAYTDGGTSVFPGNAATAPVACKISADEWRSWYEAASPETLLAKEPHVVGLVNYGSPIDSKAHYVTGFIREIHQKDYFPIEPRKSHLYELVTSGSNLGSGPVT